MKNEYIKLLKKISNDNLKSLKAKGYRVKVYKYLNEYSITLFFKKRIIYHSVIVRDTIANAMDVIHDIRIKIILRSEKINENIEK